MGNNYRPGGLNGMSTFEQEAQMRLNPYGPARPPLSQRPPRGSARRLWSKLRAVLTRTPYREDDEQGA